MIILNKGTRIHLYTYSEIGSTETYSIIAQMDSFFKNNEVIESRYEYIIHYRKPYPIYNEHKITGIHWSK